MQPTIPLTINSVEYSDDPAAFVAIHLKTPLWLLLIDSMLSVLKRADIFKIVSPFSLFTTGRLLIDHLISIGTSPLVNKQYNA